MMHVKTLTVCWFVENCMQVLHTKFEHELTLMCVDAFLHHM